ncbi:ABC transporter [Kitasatospora sp. NPDC059673]|uniref:ABC transporter n=1 Tax=Kitasatospora sp. NPDC059673 TaxID=3346901 RepID=UPI0036956A7C
MTVRMLTRYHLELLLRSQRWLPPGLLYLLLMGLGVSSGDEALSAAAFSAGLLVPVTGWLVRSAVTAEPAQSRACLVAAAGWRRVHLSGLLAAALAGLALGGAGLAAVLLVGSGGSGVAVAAGVLATVVCVLTGAAVGAVCNRPVVAGAQYAVPLGLAAMVLALLVPGSPANVVVRALVLGSRHHALSVPWWTLVGAAALAAAAWWAAVAVAERRGE